MRRSLLPLVFAVLALCIRPGMGERMLEDIIMPCTLVPAPETRPPQKTDADVVVLSGEDRISGSIKEISPEGVVLIENPLFTEAVGVRLSAVRKVTLKGEGGGSAASDVLFLTGGNRISGEIVETSAEAVVVRTESMGEVKIPRNAVARIEFKTTGNVVLETDFSTGKTGPWQVRQGKWEMREGKYHCPADGLLVAELKQEGPLTFEWTVDELQAGRGGGELSIFAKDKASTYGGDSIWIRPVGNQMYVCYARGGNADNFIRKNISDKSFASATYHASYAPSTGRLNLSVNGLDLGTFTINPPLKTGNYVMLYSENPCAYRNVRITRGVPAASAEGVKAEEMLERFILANGDELTGALQNLKEGRLAIETSYGQLEMEKGKILSVVLRTQGQKAPAPRAGDSAVTLWCGDVLTAGLNKMDEKSVEVESAVLGDLKISRDAVREIQFKK